MTSKSGSNEAGAKRRSPQKMDPDLHPPPPSPAKHRSDHQAALLRLVNWITGAAADLLALAAPVECVCCGAEDRDLCAGCAGRIRRL
ncbi:MAG TPA: ComF family protein, partial [Arthrobacter sp.]